MLFYNHHQDLSVTQMRAAGVNRLFELILDLPLPQSMVIIYKDVQDNRYLT